MSVIISFIRCFVYCFNKNICYEKVDSYSSISCVVFWLRQCKQASTALAYRKRFIDVVHGIWWSQGPVVHVPLWVRDAQGGVRVDFGQRQRGQQMVLWAGRGQRKLVQPVCFEQRRSNKYLHADAKHSVRLL